MPAAVHDSQMSDKSHLRVRCALRICLPEHIRRKCKDAETGSDGHNIAQPSVGISTPLFSGGGIRI